MVVARPKALCGRGKFRMPALLDEKREFGTSSERSPPAPCRWSSAYFARYYCPLWAGCCRRLRFGEWLLRPPLRHSIKRFPLASLRAMADALIHSAPRYISQQQSSSGYES